MDALKKVNNETYEWLKGIPRHWARSHFSSRARCDVLLNNMCEEFNRRFINGREKPIILALEYIREYCMKRMAKVHKEIDKAKGPLTPNAAIMFNEIMEQANKYKSTWNGGIHFQVIGPWMDKHVVNIQDKTCTMRKWELTSMPCKNAVCCIFNMGENGMKPDIPESFVDPVYWLQTWKRVYRLKIVPTKGRSQWPKSNCTMTITPPKQKNPIGRQKKRRKNVAELQMEKDGKLSRVAVLVQCSTCKQNGHNKMTCPKKEVRTSQGGGSKSGSSKHGTSKAGGKKVAIAKNVGSKCGKSKSVGSSGGKSNVV